MVNISDVPCSLSYVNHAIPCSFGALGKNPHFRFRYSPNPLSTDPAEDVINRSTEGNLICILRSRRVYIRFLSQGRS